MKEHRKMGRRLLFQMGIAAALAAGAATVFSFRIPPQYQARVQLLAMTHGNLAGRTGFYALPKSLPLPDYKLLFTSAEMGSRVRNWLVERRPPAGLPPDALTAEGVLRQMEVRTRVLLQTPNELRYQHVVELILTSDVPALAAEAANAWAGWCVEVAQNKRMDYTAELLELATSQLREAQAERDKTAQGLETLRLAGGAAYLEQQAQEFETAQTENDIRSIALRQAIAGAEAQLSTWETALQAGLAEAGVRAQETRAALASLRAEQEALPAAKTALQEAATAARTQWAKAQREEDQFLFEIQMLNRSVEELTQSVKGAKMAAEQVLPDFKIAASALPPDEKTSPHRGLLIMTAALLGAAALPLLRFGRIAARRCLCDMDAIGA